MYVGCIFRLFFQSAPPFAHSASVVLQDLPTTIDRSSCRRLLPARCMVVRPRGLQCLPPDFQAEQQMVQQYSAAAPKVDESQRVVALPQLCLSRLTVLEGTGGNFTPISTNPISTNLTDSLYALPSADNAEAFYTEIFTQGLAQGMVGTELDYEHVDYEKFHILRYEVGYAERWLQALSDAAVNLKVPVQFCMSYPRFILETLRLPAVTNARASDDFNVDGPAYQYQGSGGDINNNLKPFGHTTLFFWAMGLRTSKDNLWTTSMAEGPSQPAPASQWQNWSHPCCSGNATHPCQGSNCRHPNPFLHTVVAAFSTGPSIHPPVRPSLCSLV